MKAYIKVIYSSEGASPREVEEAFTDADFLKVKGGPVFEVDVTEESDLQGKLEDLHDSLRGMEVRYMPSVSLPEEVKGGETSYREKLDKWRALGIDVDDLLEVLERDEEEFREKAKDILATHVDRIADERMREVQEMEARRRLEETRERILGEVKEEGRTFHQLVSSMDIDGSIVSEILDDLMEKGRVRAEQRGRQVLFVPGD
ncbi:MAG: hypothetical protein ACLFS6_02555 [Methanomassiliicoccales archaeon]